MDLKVTIAEINRLAKQAEHGDASALASLRLMNQRLANNANRRIKRIEKTAYSPAVSAAKNWLERNNRKSFSKSSKLSPNELKAQILRERKFLSAETSTVKGVLAYRKREEERLNEMFGTGEWTDEMRENWRAFKNTTLFKELMEFDSEETIAVGLEQAKSGRLDINKVQNIYNDYISNKTTLLGAMRKWKKL